MKPHLEGVDSEVLVPAKHSCQGHPRTIIEMRTAYSPGLGLGR